MPNPQLTATAPLHELLGLLSPERRQAVTRLFAHLPEHDLRRLGLASDDAVVRPTTVRLQLLGDLDVAIDGAHVVEWHGRQGRALFAYLALHAGRTVGRDAIADAFWPDAAPQASRNRLNVAMHALRHDLRAVTAHHLVRYRQGYSLCPDVTLVVDVLEFERSIAEARAAASAGDVAAARRAYRRAIDWYGGDLLPEFAYEEWTFLRREQLRVAMLDALAYLAEQAFVAGDYGDCIQAAGRLVSVDLCREDVHRLLMRAYARLDQPHRAMRQYRSCLRQLGTELGADPTPETLDLFARIRARQPV